MRFIPALVRWKRSGIELRSALSLCHNVVLVNGELDNVQPYRSHSDHRCRRSRCGALLHAVVVGSERIARLARVAPAFGGVAAPLSAARRARRGVARGGVFSRGQREARWPPRHDRALSRHRRRPMASLSHRHARDNGRDPAPRATSFRSIGARPRQHHDRGHAHRAVCPASTTRCRAGVPQRAHARRLGAIVTFASRDVVRRSPRVSG
jgi:hypothetical protein